MPARERQRRGHALRLDRHGPTVTTCRRHPGSHEPGPAAGRPQRRHLRRGPGRGRHPARVGRAWSRTSTELGARGRLGGGPRARDAGQPARARAGDLRPLRQPHRRGALPPVVALADGARRRLRPAGRARGPSDAPHAHVRRAAGFFAWSQTEPGHGCPISMTYAAVPALRADDAIAKEWTPRLAATSYDPGLRPARGEDRRAGRHGDDREAGRLRRPGQRDRRATPTSVDGEYTLDGHKWFTSAPMNDVFLVLAQAAGRAHLLPGAAGARRRQPQPARRRTAQGQARATAPTRPPSWSSDGTWAQRLGDEGRGVRTIIEMVAATRLDCVLGSASLMRRALAEASWHVAHRSAFGGLLADKPLMQNVVADLAVESEAATALGDPAGRGGRRRRRPARGGAAPDRAAAGEVLGLQAHPDDGRRGAGVPGRQRLRRGVRACRCCSASRR